MGAFRAHSSWLVSPKRLWALGCRVDDQMPRPVAEYVTTCLKTSYLVTEVH